MEYELLDSGALQKLERFGSVVVARPDPQALWPQTLPESEWRKAHAIFIQGIKSGAWNIQKAIPLDWSVKIEENVFRLKLATTNKHVGIFPEQCLHWKWLYEKIEKEKRPLSVLNLFGYTGGASIACARAGAQVCHVDASESSLDWAKENRKLSGLREDSIRFIADDARKFVEREIRRGNRYDIILMDPPVYGRGLKKEVWNIENDLFPLLVKTKKLISNTPMAIILNGYASIYSHASYGRLLNSVYGDLPGIITSGELCVQESNGKKVLPTGIYARFEK